MERRGVTREAWRGGKTAFVSWLDLCCAGDRCWGRDTEFPEQPGWIPRRARLGSLRKAGCERHLRMQKGIKFLSHSLLKKYFICVVSMICLYVALLSQFQNEGILQSFTILTTMRIVLSFHSWNLHSFSERPCPKQSDSSKYM